jgi:hypothetical protein
MSCSHAVAVSIWQLNVQNPAIWSKKKKVIKFAVYTQIGGKEINVGRDKRKE